MCKKRMEALGRRRNVPGMGPKCCFVRRFVSRSEQVNRFDWGESRTRHRVDTPHLPALWAPAKSTWCNPGGTRPHPPPVQPELCRARPRNGKLLSPGAAPPGRSASLSTCVDIYFVSSTKGQISIHTSKRGRSEVKFAVNVLISSSSHLFHRVSFVTRHGRDTAP